MTNESSPDLCHGDTPTNRRNSARLLTATLVWLVCFGLSTFALRLEWLPEGGLRIVAALIPTIAGVWVLLAHARFIRESDELQQRQQLEALAVGYGGALLLASGYALFERLGAPKAGVKEF
ncbi:MAG: hypothetical protein AAGD38_14195, partial [Acidobacteriota bacterium]